MRPACLTKHLQPPPLSAAPSTPQLPVTGNSSENNNQTKRHPDSATAANGTQAPTASGKASKRTVRPWSYSPWTRDPTEQAAEHKRQSRDRNVTTVSRRTPEQLLPMGRTSERQAQECGGFSNTVCSKLLTPSLDHHKTYKVWGRAKKRFSMCLISRSLSTRPSPLRFPENKTYPEHKP